MTQIVVGDNEHWSWYSRPHLRDAIELPSISQEPQLVSV
jgi:hypothetical protein